jgi:hypothetical protein
LASLESGLPYEAMTVQFKSFLVKLVQVKELPAKLKADISSILYEKVVLRQWFGSYVAPAS